VNLLLNSQLDFDYLDYEAISVETVHNGRFQIIGEGFSCQVLPETRIIPHSSMIRPVSFPSGRDEPTTERPDK
jgi:hypothetical protein